MALCTQDFEIKINHLLSFAVKHCHPKDDFYCSIRWNFPGPHKRVIVYWSFERNPGLKNQPPPEPYESRLIQLRQHCRPLFDTSKCTLWMDRGEIEVTLYTLTDLLQWRGKTRICLGGRQGCYHRHLHPQKQEVKEKSLAL